MGACCGKPERKEGYVLGGSNSSSTASQQHNLNVVSSESANQTAPTTTGATTQGHLLGGSAPNPKAGDRELSPSALAAQKRADAAASRGVQAGGGKLAKKLAEERGKTHHEPDDKLPEHAGSQWN